MGCSAAAGFALSCDDLDATVCVPVGEDSGRDVLEQEHMAGLVADGHDICDLGAGSCIDGVDEFCTLAGLFGHDLYIGLFTLVSDRHFVSSVFCWCAIYQSRW